MYVCMYVCMYVYILYLYLSEFTKTDPKNIKLKVNIVFTPPHPYPPPAKMMKYMRRDAMKYGSDIYIYGQSIKQMTSLITTQDVHFYAKNKSPLTCK